MRLDELRGRMGALEAAVNASRELPDLRARLDTIATAQARLTARDGPLVGIVTAEVDRLDGYLLHHAATLRAELAALRDDARALRDDARSLRNDVQWLRDDAGSLRNDVQWLRDDAGSLRDDVRSLRDPLLGLARRPERAYAAQGMDALIMAGGFDLVVPTREEGLLAFLLGHGPGAVEPGVSTVLRDRLRPGGVAVDGGANIGLHALTIAAAVGPAGQLTCFEPLPHLADALERTLRLNGFAGHSRVERAALSDAVGEATLHAAPHSPMSSLFSLPDSTGASPLTVPTVTLDSQLAPGGRLDLLKLDIEGAEPRAWRGMQRVLEDNREIDIIMEWSSSHFAKAGESPRNLDDPRGRLLRLRGRGCSRARPPRPARGCRRGGRAGRRERAADLAVGTSVAVSGSVEERLGRLEERQRLLKDAVVRGFWQVMDRLDEAILPGRRMTCPICSTTEPRERLDARIDHCFFGGGRLERYVCPHCGCIFGPAKCLELNAGMLEADYALLYDGYAEADSTECEIRAFRSLLPVPAGPFLNWGCGRWSHSIPALRAEGHDVWGFEPSAPPGAQPFIATRREQISARFAGIFSNNVIEHMIRPVEEFRYSTPSCSPVGGWRTPRLAIATPTATPGSTCCS